MLQRLVRVHGRENPEPGIFQDGHDVHQDHPVVVDHIFAVLESLKEQIKGYERQLRLLAKRNPTIVRLMTIPAIGYLTALTYVSTIDDPARFKRSEDVGPYLGLTPRVHQSGEMDRTGALPRPATRSRAPTSTRPPVCC